MLSSAEGFPDLAAAFAQAAQQAPAAVCTSTYLFAGRAVRMRIAGRLLAAQIARPFGHLCLNEAGNQAPQATIDLWDESEADIACPQFDDFGLHRTWSLPEHEHVWPVEGGTLSASADGRFVCYRYRQSLACLDRAAQHIIGWVGSAEQLSSEERTKPLRLLLSTWYSDQGIQTIHAGLVAWRGQGMLFCGANGSGKSTAALACLCAGFDYLGDDHVGLQATDNQGFTGYSLYGTARLAESQQLYFPVLQAHARPGDGGQDKLLVHLAEVYPDRLIRATPIQAIVLPRVTQRQVSQMRPASKREVWTALVPSSLMMGLGAGAAGFERLGDLIESKPGFWLELRAGVQDIPVLARQVLGEG